MSLRVLPALLLAITSLVACPESAEPLDVRFHTPQATIRTLFEVYGVAELSQAEVRARMLRYGRFHLNDPATLRACFADWDEDEDEALAGYVFGQLAPNKDDVHVTMTEDLATAVSRDEEGTRSRPVKLTREGGRWLIILAESVPRSAQRRLRSAAQQ